MSELRFNVKSGIIEQDINAVLGHDLPWQQLRNKHVVITGATGMLAAYIVETLLTLNDVKVTILVRNILKAQKRFSKYLDHPFFSIKAISLLEKITALEPCNFLFHAASIPRPDTSIPVDVLAPNIVGTWNLLEYAKKCKNFEQFVFFSSGAVYGDNPGTNNKVQETDFFPIPFTDVKSCYAVGKIASENMCVCFMKQFGIPIKILRYAHTYGPGMDIQNDPRSFVSFLRCILSGRNIELLSDGSMTRNFCYIADATAALFYILFKGKNGEAYNIVNEAEEISIAELADLLVSISPIQQLKVIHQHSAVPTGYAPQQISATAASTKLSNLGWKPKISVRDGFCRTIQTYEMISNQ